MQFIFITEINLPREEGVSEGVGRKELLSHIVYNVREGINIRKHLIADQSVSFQAPPHYGKIHFLRTFRKKISVFYKISIRINISRI